MYRLVSRVCYKLVEEIAVLVEQRQRGESLMPAELVDRCLRLVLLEVEMERIYDEVGQ
jgi:hypothetical protein